MTKSSRYVVQNDPESGHDCCFSATVVDTQPKGQRAGSSDPLCDCYTVEDAERICAALNATEDKADD